MFTQAQIDQFHHVGTIVVKNLIKAEELEDLYMQEGILTLQAKNKLKN